MNMNTRTYEFMIIWIYGYDYINIYEGINTRIYG